MYENWIIEHKTFGTGIVNIDNGDELLVTFDEEEFGEKVLSTDKKDIAYKLYSPNEFNKREELLNSLDWITKPNASHTNFHGACIKMTDKSMKLTIYGRYRSAFGDYIKIALKDGFLYIVSCQASEGGFKLSRPKGKTESPRSATINFLTEEQIKYLNKHQGDYDLENVTLGGVSIYKINLETNKYAVKNRWTTRKRNEKLDERLNQDDM